MTHHKRGGERLVQRSPVHPPPVTGEVLCPGAQGSAIVVYMEQLSGQFAFLKLRQGFKN